MISQDIEVTFPNGQKLPDPIRSICRFLDGNGYPISGCFELSTIGIDDMNHWFHKTPAAVNQLLPFGRGACGDVYALWLTEGLAPDEAPVVMFGSEGELKVLALNSLEFCRLLCLGYSEVGLEDHSLPSSEYEETRRFRSYMIQQFTFELPKNGDCIIQPAMARFPNFEAWVRLNAWGEKS
jgi:hypothetical protein